MKAKRLEYKNKRIMHNGTTTIVNGYTQIINYCDIENMGRKLSEELLRFHTFGFIAKGVAKLNPEDTYDEKKGLVVASNKAKIKGNRRIQREAENLLNLLNKYKAMLSDTLEEAKNNIKEAENRIESFIEEAEARENKENK